jgi:hypothetical protein
VQLRETRNAIMHDNTNYVGCCANAMSDDEIHARPEIDSTSI